MDSNISITTGCFTHKRNLKKKKSGINNQVTYLKLFRKLWQSTERKIKIIEENAYQETFDALIKFVKECQINKVAEVNEIPAAILVMGVNMPDHSNIFYLLEQQIHSSGVPATVVLQSKDCGTQSSLMQKLVTTVIDHYQNEMGLEHIVLKKLDYTFSKLLTYYSNLPSVESRSSPRKSKTKKTGAKDLKSQPMVFFIQDVESFNISVLQEFILSSSLYIGKLPIVLIFGMASAMVTLHNILPQKVLSCLGIETFYSMTAIEYLTRIIQEVVLSSENPLKFGPKVFRLIVDTVLYHDFSVTNLTLLLKFCMFEHFYNNPLAAASCHSSEITAAHLQQLSKEDLSLFRKLPSFTKFMENNPECKIAIKNEKEFKILVADLLKKHHSYHKLLIILLNLLHILVKDLPGSPFGKHFREIYPMALENAITSVASYSQVESLLKALSRQELESKLLLCLAYLTDTELSCSDSYVSEVKKLLEVEVEKLRNADESSDIPAETFPIDDDFEKITSRSQLQEKLKQRLKAKRSKFDKCRENVIQTLTSIFKNLHPPSELPLFEVLYFDNAIALKRHLMVVPRATIHKNLMNPQLILKCQCCDINESRQITSTMPDICSLYKLHLECGKLVNLYDCLEAFKSLKEKEVEKDSEADVQLNVRFMHAISELQLLGFLKPTKRKTDHMAKLTFGGF